MKMKRPQLLYVVKVNIHVTAHVLLTIPKHSEPDPEFESLDVEIRTFKCHGCK